MHTRVVFAFSWLKVDEHTNEPHQEKLTLFVCSLFLRPAPGSCREYSSNFFRSQFCYRAALTSCTCMHTQKANLAPYTPTSAWFYYYVAYYTCIFRDEYFHPARAATMAALLLSRREVAMCSLTHTWMHQAAQFLLRLRLLK